MEQIKKHIKTNRNTYINLLNTKKKPTEQRTNLLKTKTFPLLIRHFQNQTRSNPWNCQEKEDDAGCL